MRMGGYVTEQDKAGVLSELQAWRTLLTHIEKRKCSAGAIFSKANGSSEGAAVRLSSWGVGPRNLKRGG